MWGQHVLKTWPATQAMVALSSVEVQLYALVKGGAQMRGMQAIARDRGMSLEGKIHTDASAALGIVPRQGLGKLRHIATHYMGIQDKVRNAELHVAKVPGTNNPADILTKNVPAAEILKHTESLGVELGGGRAATAPHLSCLMQSRRSRRRQPRCH